MIDSYTLTGCVGKFEVFASIPSEFLLISSLPGKALRTLVDIARLASDFTTGIV